MAEVLAAGAAGDAEPGPEAEAWKRLLSEAVRDAGELCRLLGLPESVAAEAAAAQGAFPLLVPRGFVARMRPADPRDPLLLQVLPVAAETSRPPGYVDDPLEERGAVASPGLVRKYAGRALVLVTGGCAVNCRYCFRRSFPYAEAGATQAGLAEAVSALADDARLEEVILSGGDPLLLDDDRLARLVERLEAIPHLQRLRIHSRLPIVLPERVTPRLVDLLDATRLEAVLVVHANHAAELDATVAAALERLARGGVRLFNQAVLLAGVNDSVESLVALSRRLVSCRVAPYYLHLLDRVTGAAHFEVADERAVALHAAIREQLPGYAVPRLVREIPGEPSKTWLA